MRVLVLHAARRPEAASIPEPRLAFLWQRAPRANLSPVDDLFSRVMNPYSPPAEGRSPDGI